MNISNRKAGRKLHFAPLALSVAVAADCGRGER